MVLFSIIFPYSVTFDIDGLDDCDFVSVTGTWDNWSGWGAHTDNGFLASIPAGSYEYVILCTSTTVDGWYNNIWGNSTVINADDLDCAVPQTVNYGFSVDSDMTVSICAGSCDTTCDTAEPPDGYSVTFEIDMSDSQYPNTEYDQCGINGSWNNWMGWGITLEDSDNNGIFTGTLNGLSDGIYEYVIFCSGEADGWSGWGVSIDAPLGTGCDWNPNDEWPNYGFEIQGSNLIESHCAGDCEYNCGNDSNGDSQSYTLVWSDEFNGTEIDESKWNFETGNGNWGWGNGEHQYYRQDNAFIEDGILVIEARNEAFGGFNYTSTRMQTRNKGDWLYGKVKARIRVPSAGGTWPAFWMMPTNSVYGGWPNSGEIDILEHYGCDLNHVHSTVHNTMYNWNGGSPPTSYSAITSATSDFHE